MISKRKMGHLEVASYLFNLKADGTMNISVLCEIDLNITKNIFIAAWKDLCRIHPMLRAFVSKEGDDYFFKFLETQDLSNIKFISMGSGNDINAFYDNELSIIFHINDLLWRAVMITDKCSSKNYLIFSACHCICDAKSCAMTVNQFVNISNNIIKNRPSLFLTQAVPESIEKILDYSQFENQELEECIYRQYRVDYREQPSMIRSSNQFKNISNHLLTRMKEKCKIEKTTINSLLCSAYILSAQKNREKRDKMHFSFAFDLRPYILDSKFQNSLAFYAHQLSVSIDTTMMTDFWGLARQVQLNYKLALKNYSLFGASHKNIEKHINLEVSTAYDDGTYYLPYAISNAGNLDDILSNTNIKSFYYTVRNKGIFSGLLTASSIRNNLYLNFNYSIPSTSKEDMNKIIEGTFSIIKTSVRS